MDAHKCKAEKSWPVFTSVSLHFWSHCEGSGWCKGIRVVQHHPDPSQWLQKEFPCMLMWLLMSNMPTSITLCILSITVL